MLTLTICAVGQLFARLTFRLRKESRPSLLSLLSFPSLRRSVIGTQSTVLRPASRSNEPSATCASARQGR